MSRSLLSLSRLRLATPNTIGRLRVAMPRSRSYSEQQQQQQSPKPPKQVSPHIGFYKSFGRPIAKVFLMSIVVYQATYWLWKKLESDEYKRDKTDEITQLEEQLTKLTDIKNEKS